MAAPCRRKPGTTSRPLPANLARALAASVKPVQLTRPDGSKVAIDAAKVSAVRAVLPGEYDASVHSVISMGRARQGVQEDAALVEQRLRRHGMRV